MFHVFVHVLDHHDGTINHRADRNGDATERHDVGIEPLQMHYNERRENAHRQADNGHQTGANMEQKHHADQCHHDQLLQQFVPEIVHRPFNQAGPIVDRDDLDPGRQSGLQGLEPGLDASDSPLGIFTNPHHHDAAHHFALTVQFRDAAAHLWTDPDIGHILEQQRCAVDIETERDRGEVLYPLDITAGAHHVFRLRHLDDRCAHFLITPLDGLLNVRQRHVEGAQLIRVHFDLILPDHAAQGGYFGYARHGLQFILQEPVLQTAQLADIVLAGSVYQRIQIHPAHAGGIRPQLWPGTGGQGGRDLGQVFQHSRARPVSIGLFIEDHINIGVAEEGIAAYCHRAGHRQHGGCQRIGDLVFHHLGCLPGIAGLDDHLHVGQVRDGIHRRVSQRPDTHPHQNHGSQQHKQAVADGPNNNGLNHVYAPVDHHRPDPIQGGAACPDAGCDPWAEPLHHAPCG